MEETMPQAKMGRMQYLMRFIALFFRFLFDNVTHFVANRVRVVFGTPDLFLGAGLLVLGLLNFNTGRYCDGNAGNYLSCTRSAVYYYFDAVDITLIVIGVFLVLTWFVKKYEHV